MTKKKPLGWVISHETYVLIENLFDMTSEAYPKRIPYGMMNFVDMRKENALYLF